MREFSLTAHLNVIKANPKEKGLKAMQAKRGMLVVSNPVCAMRERAIEGKFDGEKENGFENDPFGNNGLHSKEIRV